MKSVKGNRKKTSKILAKTSLKKKQQSKNQSKAKTVKNVVKKARNSKSDKCEKSSDTSLESILSVSPRPNKKSEDKVKSSKKNNVKETGPRSKKTKVSVDKSAATKFDRSKNGDKKDSKLTKNKKEIEDSKGKASGSKSPAKSTSKKDKKAARTKKEEKALQEMLNSQAFRPRGPRLASLNASCKMQLLYESEHDKYQLFSSSPSSSDTEEQEEDATDEEDQTTEEETMVEDEKLTIPNHEELFTEDESESDDDNDNKIASSKIGANSKKKNSSKASFSSMSTASASSTPKTSKQENLKKSLKKQKKIAVLPRKIYKKKSEVKDEKRKSKNNSKDKKTSKANEKKRKTISNTSKIPRKRKVVDDPVELIDTRSTKRIASLNASAIMSASMANEKLAVAIPTKSMSPAVSRAQEKSLHTEKGSPYTDSVEVIQKTKTTRVINNEVTETIEMVKQVRQMSANIRDRLLAIEMMESEAADDTDVMDTGLVEEPTTDEDTPVHVEENIQPSRKKASSKKLNSSNISNSSLHSPKRKSDSNTTAPGFPSFLSSQCSSSEATQVTSMTTTTTKVKINKRRNLDQKKTTTVEKIQYEVHGAFNPFSHNMASQSVNNLRSAVPGAEATNPHATAQNSYSVPTSSPTGPMPMPHPMHSYGFGPSYCIFPSYSNQLEMAYQQQQLMQQQQLQLQQYQQQMQANAGYQAIGAAGQMLAAPQLAMLNLAAATAAASAEQNRPSTLNGGYKSAFSVPQNVIGSPNLLPNSQEAATTTSSASYAPRLNGLFQMPEQSVMQPANDSSFLVHKPVAFNAVNTTPSSNANSIFANTSVASSIANGFQFRPQANVTPTATIIQHPQQNPLQYFSSQMLGNPGYIFQGASPLAQAGLSLANPYLQAPFSGGLTGEPLNIALIQAQQAAQMGQQNHATQTLLGQIDPTHPILIGGHPLNPNFSTVSNLVNTAVVSAGQETAAVKTTSSQPTTTTAVTKVNTKIAPKPANSISITQVSLPKASKPRGHKKKSKQVDAPINLTKMDLTKTNGFESVDQAQPHTFSTPLGKKPIESVTLKTSGSLNETAGELCKTKSFAVGIRKDREVKKKPKTLSISGCSIDVNGSTPIVTPYSQSNGIGGIKSTAHTKPSITGKMAIATVGPKPFLPVLAPEPEPFGSSTAKTSALSLFKMKQMKNSPTLDARNASPVTTIYLEDQAPTKKCNGQPASKNVQSNGTSITITALASSKASPSIVAGNSCAPVGESTKHSAARRPENGKKHSDSALSLFRSKEASMKSPIDCIATSNCALSVTLSQPTTEMRTATSTATKKVVKGLNSQKEIKAKHTSDSKQKSSAEIKSKSATEVKTKPMTGVTQTLSPSPVHGWRWEGEPSKKLVLIRPDEPAQLRMCYPRMRHLQGDIINVRDCVLLRSGPTQKDVPFVAKIRRTLGRAQYKSNDDESPLVLQTRTY